MSRSLVMPTSSTMTTVSASRAWRPWSRRHNSDAMVRLSMPASRPRVRAACPGRGRPDHPVPGGLVGVSDTGQCGRLARPRHPDHEFHPPPGGRDGPHGVGLAVGERAAQLGFLAGDGRLNGARRDGGSAGGLDAVEERRGDGGLNGDDRRRGVDPLPGAGDPDEGDDLGVPQQHVDRPDQLRRVAAEDPGSDRDDHVPAGNTLRAARRPSGANTSSRRALQLVKGQGGEQRRERARDVPAGPVDVPDQGFGSEPDPDELGLATVPSGPRPA